MGGAGTEAARGGDIVGLPRGQDVAAGDAIEVHPSLEGQGEDEGQQIRPGGGHDGEGEDQEGEGQQRVNDAGHHRVEPTAEVAGQHAEAGARHQSEENDRDAEQDGDAARRT